MWIGFPYFIFLPRTVAGNDHRYAGQTPEFTECVESADHGGAVFGALITGLVLAPVVGLGLSACVLAGLKILSGLILLRPFRI